MTDWKKKRAKVGRIKQKVERRTLTGWTCPKTGKRSYPDKKAARAARNTLDNGLSIFRCDNHFHIGHSGAEPREQHREWHGR